MKAQVKKHISSTLAVLPRNGRSAVARAGLLAILSFTLLICIVPGYSSAQQSQADSRRLAQPSAAQIREQLNRIFEDHQELELDLRQVTREVAATGQVALKLRGEHYDLQLELNDLRDPEFRSTRMTDQGLVESPPEPVSTYKGKVAGDPASEVRLTIQPDLFFGYVLTNDDWFFIDPLAKFVPGVSAERLVAYREKDIRPEFSGTCGAGALEQESDRLIEQANPQAPATLQNSAASLAVTHSFRTVRVATEADFATFQITGNNTNASLQGIINLVDGIYLRELNLKLVISYQHVWTTNTPPSGGDYPYTSTDSHTLLDAFRTVWNDDDLKEKPRDVAHLFTWTNLDASVAGSAYTGTVCDRSRSYSLSSLQGLTAQIVRTVAHEIGHNLGALHDYAAMCGGNGPIMCSAVQQFGGNQFSQYSKDKIATYINSSGGCLRARIRQNNFDFDGDGKTDFAVFRPSTGEWHIISSATGTYTKTQFGQSTDTIIPGDYDGDGRTDIAVWRRSYRPAVGIWFIRYSSNGSTNTFYWGYSTDVPVPGDYDGDGKTDLAAWEPTTGNWKILRSSDGSTITKSQYASGKPVLGDFDGDGKIDPTVWNPATGEWYILYSSGGGNVIYQWGVNGDVPVPGDYDSDGQTDRAVWRPSTGHWHVTLSTNGSIKSWQWGNAYVLPVPGDYEGDAMTDAAYWQPSDGYWWAMTYGYPTKRQLGISTDIPVPCAYIRR
jgi:hypothetical protein